MRYDGVFLKILQEVENASRFTESKKFKQHGHTSVFRHSCNVALLSSRLASIFRWKVDRPSLLKGALLHDYFLYDWHDKDPAHRWHGLRHPAVAYANAKRDFILTPTETDIIRHHMFPLTPTPPKSAEAVFVCIADKICAVLEILRIM